MDTNVFDFHAELLKVARTVAVNGSRSIPSVWKSFLTQLLHQWDANVAIDLGYATAIMIESAGYCYGDGISPIPSLSHDFWYSWSPTLDLPLNMVMPFFLNFISFKVTIAIFETINDWFLSKHSNSIIFNEINLKEMLKYHKVNINWQQYKKF